MHDLLSDPSIKTINKANVVGCVLFPGRHIYVFGESIDEVQNIARLGLSSLGVALEDASILCANKAPLHIDILEAAIANQIACRHRDLEQFLDNILAPLQVVRAVMEEDL